MCGIVGYVGSRPPVPLLLESLRRLEYRGYDSAGIAVRTNGTIHAVRALGKLSELVRKLESGAPEGTHGLGHTRWATHGRPSERNAHPIVDSRGRVAVIHNGIIENFQVLREELTAAGWTFSTETDTEVVANLVSAELDRGPDLRDAVARAVRRLEGHFAFAAVSTTSTEDEIVATRRGAPLVLGVNGGEQFLASDATALLGHTKKVVFLENGDVARLLRDRVEIHDRQGEAVERRPRRLSWDPVQAEKGPYRHFMLKEIHEQPRILQESFAGRLDVESGRVDLGDWGIEDERLARIERIHLLACGTSWHAGLVAKFFFEELVGLPVEVDYASEYRYRSAVVDEKVLAIGISQSGETADTLGAMEAAGERSALLACVCNVPESQATRISDGVLLTRAGPEIGVASTKAFTTQLVVLFLLALHLRRVRLGRDEPDLVRAVAGLPAAVATVLEKEKRIAKLARKFRNAEDALFLGRGINYPIALEGALKLKEISYVHAEGYPAGEMKHGPIALIDGRMPTVAVATGDRVFEKMVGNLQEVRARDGEILAVTDRPDDLEGTAHHLLPVPRTVEMLQPVVNVVPLQLLAYHAGVARGADVDQPRNLAKSVTVE